MSNQQQRCNKDESEEKQDEISVGGSTSPGTIISSQLPVCVLIQRLRSKEYVSTGGGFCICNDGLIVTAYHVVEPDHESEAGSNFRVLFYGDDDYLDAEVVEDSLFPSFDIAFLRITGDRKSFPHVNIGDNVNVDLGEKLAAHGHTGSFAFSSQFGEAAYPYTTHTSYLDNLIANRDDNTMEFTSTEELRKSRENYPTPPFRTLAGCLSEKKSLLLGHKNPYLPFIQVSGLGRPQGFSGTPVFKEDTLEVVGVVSCGNLFYTYLVPVDVISRLVNI